MRVHHDLVSSQFAISPKSYLQSLLNIGDLLDRVEHVDDAQCDDTNQDTRGRNQDRVHHSGPVGGNAHLAEFCARRRNDESSTGGLGKRPEEIGAHTSDVTDIITDVVSDAGRVARIVLVETVVVLASGDLDDGFEF